MSAESNTPDKNLETHPSAEKAPASQETKEPPQTGAVPGGSTEAKRKTYEDEPKILTRQKQVWRDPELGSTHTLSVLVVLATLLGEDDACEVTHAELARLTRMTPRSLHNHVNKAEELGYFTRSPGSGRTATIYRAAGRWIT